MAACRCWLSGRNTTKLERFRPTARSVVSTCDLLLISLREWEACICGVRFGRSRHCPQVKAGKAHSCMPRASKGFPAGWGGTKTISMRLCALANIGVILSGMPLLRNVDSLAAVVVSQNQFNEQRGHAAPMLPTCGVEAS